MHTGSYMSASRPKTKQLTSNEIFDFAFNRIIGTRNEYAERINVTLIKPNAGGTETVYGVRFAANNKNVVLLSAASDKATANMNEGNVNTTPLPDVLSKVRELQALNPQDVYLFPLSECGTMLFGFTARQHFTLLVIENNECYFYDPCSDSYAPWSVSGSSFYSLAPMTEFLTKSGFNLEKTNITYLGWQSNKDFDNCGRFCATIAGRIADMYFADKKLALIKSDLAQAFVEPSGNEALATMFDTMIADAAECVTDKSILSSNEIVFARGQQPYPRTLKPADLNQYGAVGDNVFEEYQQNGFFEVGAGGLHQFKLEADRLRTRFFINGVACADIFKSETKTLEVMAAELGLSVEYFQTIVSAHSQGPLAFIPMILDEGVTKLAEPTIKIGQPAVDDLRVDLTTQADGVAQLVCYYQRLPIKSYLINNLIRDYIEGPVSAIYTLQQNVENKWGWQLKSINTENHDILRILSGFKLPERYFTRPLSDIITTKLSTVVAINTNYAEEKAAVDNSEQIKKLQEQKAELAARIKSLEYEKDQLAQKIEAVATALNNLLEASKDLEKEKDDALKSGSLALIEMRRYSDLNSTLRNQLASALLKVDAAAIVASKPKLDSPDSAAKKELLKSSESLLKANQEILKLQEQIKKLKADNEKLKENAKAQNELIKQLTQLQEKLNVVESSKEALDGKNVMMLRELKEQSTRNNQLLIEIEKLQQDLSKQSELHHEALAGVRDAKEAFAELKKERQDKLTDALNRIQSMSHELYMSHADLSGLKENNETKELSHQTTTQEMQLQILQLEKDNQALQQNIATVEQDNARLTILTTKPYQPVIRYAAATLITTGASVTTALTALGVISLGLLAAVPVIGWGIAAGFMLALTLVLATKGVQNFLANRSQAQIVPAIDAAKDGDNASPSVSISVAQLSEDKELSQTNEVDGQFAANKSGLQVYGLLAQRVRLEAVVTEDKSTVDLKSFYSLT
jgi:hypothetical protein